MKWNQIISPSELESSYTLFPGLKNRKYAKLVGRLLEKFGDFLGYPVGIVLPHDVAPYAGDEESLRALRLLVKFRDEGFLSSFYSAKHSYADEPHGEVTLATLKDIKRFGFSGKGADMFNRSATLWPAAGEAVERYAMEFYYPKKGEYIDASWNDIPDPKVDIFSVAGFDEKLRKQGHPDFALACDADTKFRWVKAIELPSKKEIWAPLQWFSFSHVQQYAGKYINAKQPGFTQEPLISVPITTGVAAGQNTTDALLRGLLEVIERDAFIIYWLNQIPARRIDITSFGEERFLKLKEITDRYGLESHILYLHTDMPTHTVCSIVLDRSGIGPALVVGAKTGLSLSDAAYGAVSDTIAQRGLYRGMMESDECKKQVFDDHNKIGHIERMYYWFGHERLKDIETFISGELVHADTLPTYQYPGTDEEDLAQLLRFFNEKGYPVYYKELLNEKLKKMTEGLSVTMVKVPKMQPVYLDESLRSIAGERLYSVPEFLGYPRKSETIDDFSKIPHPFP